MTGVQVNQVSQPYGTYSAKQYYFPQYYYYSGYIYNPSENSLVIQIQTQNDVLQPLTIPSNTILYIESLDIFILYFSQGSYTFSFIGSDVKGTPKFELVTLEVIIGAAILTNASLAGSTSSTASTKQQVTTTSTLVRHFQFVNTGSATINIGDANNQAIPVTAGSIFVWDGNNEETDLSQWYTFSGTASVPYVVVYQY